MALAAESVAFSEAYNTYNELVAARNFREAESYAESAYELGKEKFGEKSEEAGNLALNVGVVKNRLGEFKKAEPFLGSALKILESVHGENSIKLLDAYMELTMNALGQGKDGRTRSFYRTLNKLVTSGFGEDSAALASLTLELANFAYSHASSSAEEFYKDALAYGETAFPEGHYLIGYAAFGLGKIYLGSGPTYRKWTERYLILALENFEKSPPPVIENVVIAHGLLTELYSEMGKDELATYHCVAVGKIRGDYDLNEFQALYKILPKYPESAYDRRKEGYVVVEFKVTVEGRVADPVVIETTSDAFSRAAMDVITKWRYAPRVVEGSPVETLIRNRMEFRIGD